MEILIIAINYQGHPLVWKYEKNKDSATCLFKLINASNAPEKSELIALLRSFPQIKIINEEEAVIENASEFFTIYEMKPVKASTFSNFETSKTFFSPQSKQSKSSRVAGIDIPKLSLSDFDSDFASGIEMNALFPKTENADLTQWSQTRAHEGYFSSKTEEDLQTRQYPVFQTRVTIERSLQYLKNPELYPIKTQQMVLLRRLFDEILNPIYKEINGDNPAPSQLITYFKNAVLAVMINGKYNSGMTEYDRMPKEVLLEKFANDETLVAYAWDEARRPGARVMSRNLRNLIHDVKLEIQDRILQEQLSLLKEKALTQKETINQILEELEDCIIQSGKVEYKFEEISQNTKRQLAETPKTIQIPKIIQKPNKRSTVLLETHHSCFHLIDLLITESYSKKDRKRNKNIDSEIRAIMGKIALRTRTDIEFTETNLTPALASTETNLYFSEKLAKKFSQEMKELFKGKPYKFARSKSKQEIFEYSQSEEVYQFTDSQTEVASFVVDFIKRQLPESKRLASARMPLSCGRTKEEPLIRARVPYRKPTPSAHLDQCLETEKRSDLTGYFSS